MGKFYELFEMDAHIGAKELDLQYMKVLIRLGAFNTDNSVFVQCPLPPPPPKQKKKKISYCSPWRVLHHLNSQKKRRKKITRCVFILTHIVLMFVLVYS